MRIALNIFSFNEFLCLVYTFVQTKKVKIIILLKTALMKFLSI